MKRKETLNYYYNYIQINVSKINFKCCTSFSINNINYGQVFIAGVKARNVFWRGGEGLKNVY